MLIICKLQKSSWVAQNAITGRVFETPVVKDA